MLGRDGGEVHELKTNVFVGHHPGLGVLGRERIRRDLRPGAREPRMQRRLARVRRPDQRNLRRALGADHDGRAAASPALLGPLQLFGQLLDAPLDVALEMVRPLVLGDHAEHLSQPLQALPRVARLAEGSLRGPVLGREVGWHDGVGAEFSRFASLSSGSAGDTFILRARSIPRY
jgi:hypothetical protein